MKAVHRAAAVAALVSMSAPAMAKDKWAVQPVQVGQETIRYLKGVPTLDLELKDGVVQITPVAMEHGSVAFEVAVYNDSRQPANFGIENVAVLHGGAGVKVFSKDELVKRAENRAMWTSIALAALGGVAAAAAANQRNHYRSTFVTPRGTYRSYWSGPSAAGQVQAAAIAAGTGVGIAGIQSQLDNTRVALGEEIIQTTTVDPGESYAGRIVLAKIKPKTLPSRVQLTINWNGEAYPFTFQVAKRGTAAPTFTAMTRSSDLTNFAAEKAAPAPAVIAPAASAPLVVPVAQPVAPQPPTAAPVEKPKENEVVPVPTSPI